MEIIAYKDRMIIDTNHSIDRFIDKTRFKDASKEEFKNQINKVITNGMKKIIDTYNDRMATYGIWSRSTGICVIIDWRKDNRNLKDKHNHAVIVTLPPIKDNFNDFHTKQGDTRIIVEKYLHNYIMKLLQTEGKNLDRSKNALLTFRLSEEMMVTYYEGILWDSGIRECIEVE